MIIAPILLASMVSASPGPSVPLALTLDTPAKVGNIETVCTGVGLDARQNAAWTSYPLRIEVAGRGGQYLGDVNLTISQGSSVLATVTCAGPWLLFRLPAGRYKVEAGTEGKSVTSPVLVPATGQSRVILRFPDLGGVIEVPGTNPPASLPLMQ